MNESKVHSNLVKAFEHPIRRCLWIEADSVTFTPRVLQKVYGDGRAVFAFSTLNQRPRFWVVRACSKTYLGEFSDEILTDLEEAFGSGRCSDSYNNLFESKRYRMRYCKCEECSDRFVARFPMVDGDGGTLWGRLRWPDGFDTDKSRETLALAAPPAEVKP